MGWEVENQVHFYIFFFTISRTMLNFIHYKNFFQNFIFSSNYNYPEIATFSDKRVSCILWVSLYFYTSSKLPTRCITDSLILRIVSEKKRIAKLFWFIIVFIDIVNLWPQKIGSCYNEFLVHHRMYLYVSWYMYDDDQSKLERRFKMHSSTSLIYP